MRLHNGIDAERLMQMLRQNLIKEQDQWKPKAYNSVDIDTSEVNGNQRDEAVRWMLFLNRRFGFTPETFGLSVSLLDRFHCLVKVRPKYLHCVAISCLYIAAKTLEEEEVIPSTVDLVKISQCSCSVAEILRMELAILNKLSWNSKFVTAVDFLHIIHGLLMNYFPQLLKGLSDMTPSRHLGLLMRRLFCCYSDHRLMTFRPVTLAMTVICLELEQMTPNWLSMVIMVQQMAKIDNEDFIQCREESGRFLTSNKLLPTGYKFSAQKLLPKKSIKRKASILDDEDDIYDGIKRLYNEDSNDVRMSCAKELHQDNQDNFIQMTTVSAN
ncbi:Hypothetical predicted protein [Mytilus galloprovincialis]|uniref:Cyclin-like domain-containing protein n=1 Tax=Mytilus galloprovincialis TaxID=29158 RepID=A0A8B6EVE3_MYTGA|nr:Hypothetical predicted protein [Mytilus galloprovincialis]